MTPGTLLHQPVLPLGCVVDTLLAARGRRKVLTQQQLLLPGPLLPLLIDSNSHNDDPGTTADALLSHWSSTATSQITIFQIITSWISASGEAAASLQRPFSKIYSPRHSHSSQTRSSGAQTQKHTCLCRCCCAQQLQRGPSTNKLTRQQLQTLDMDSNRRGSTAGSCWWGPGRVAGCCEPNLCTRAAARAAGGFAGGSAAAGRLEQGGEGCVLYVHIIHSVFCCICLVFTKSALQMGVRPPPDITSQPFA